MFFLSSVSRNFDDQLSPDFHRLVILSLWYDTPHENTGLWQLPNVYSAFNAPVNMCTLLLCMFWTPKWQTWDVRLSALRDGNESIQGLIRNELFSFRCGRPKGKPQMGENNLVHEGTQNPIHKIRHQLSEVGFDLGVHWTSLVHIGYEKKSSKKGHSNVSLWYAHTFQYSGQTCNVKVDFHFISWITV